MKKILSLIVALFVACSVSVLAEVHYKTLEKVNEPKDIKEFTVKQMESLAKDIRGAILNKTNLVGGHVGPDLGIVEVTIAMHYVFDSPTDKFIFDTSHQCYPHKMLTGRKDAFIDPLHHQNITGFSNFNESPHDFFIMGHTSTSVTLASGMAKARDLKGEKYNVIALIGDGSLSGGEALEGLNNAAVLGSNMIIIVNDNEMCIAENHGGLYKNLKELRDTNGTSPNNMFTALGYDYYYVSDGHDLQGLIDMFKKVKDTNKPTVVHIHTTKGKGYIPAMQNKEKYHWTTPGFMDKKPEVVENPPETYTKLTVDYIMNKAQTDKTFVTVSPATPGICGLFSEERQKLGKNYTDVGIAEQHAVGYVSGIAKNGGKPVLIVHSSFIQRAYDQLSQDMAINNAPAVILIVGHGISCGDVTHNGVFDIPLISNIPNIVYMSPTNKEEYLAILDWAVKQNKYPVAIRVPQGEVVSSGKFDSTDYSKLNKFKVASEGSEIAIIAEGNFFELGKKVQALIKEKLNIDATLINPVYLTGVDYDLLERLKQNHTLVVTLEDGVLDGGFGEKISRFYSNSDMKVLNYGAKKEFTDRVPVEELYKKYHLEPELILTDIVEVKEMTDKGVNTEGVNPEGVNSKGVNEGVNKGVNNAPEPEKAAPAENKVEKAAPETKTEVKEEAKPAKSEEVKSEEKSVVTDKKEEVKEVKQEPKKVEMPEVKPAEPQSEKPVQKKKKFFKK
ncbi:MAG: 1-deoxy-D-xylulose-5-phosphate synthase [Cyanobacteria bacterium RUI128]|nr:1-deoxy-D-xylulose-5-phosphate synthase [Cyanobacteria bacterium RUI128]